MKGRARAAKHTYDLQIIGAWHTAVFGVRAYVGKLDRLQNYLEPGKATKAQTADEMVAVFQQFAARGAPISIKQLN